MSKFRVLFVFAALVLFTSYAIAQDNQKPLPSVISGGVLNGKARQLVMPPYPPAAKAVRASGAVNVQVVIDEGGNVISASAVSGHPLLRAAAVEAARASKFSPTTLSGQPVKVSGIIVYNFFQPGINWRGLGRVLGDVEAEIENIDFLRNQIIDLKKEFPEESRALSAVVENFEKNEETGRRQPAAISGIITALQSKISSQPQDAWEFELGLAIGRIQASSYDESVLRMVLPKFRDLAPSAREYFRANNELKEVSEMSNNSRFSRKDKIRIQELIESL